MDWIKRLYYKLVPTYRRIEIGSFPYSLADKMIRGNEGKPESEQWVIAKEEDVNPHRNHLFLEPHVWLERRERLLR